MGMYVYICNGIYNQQYEMDGKVGNINKVDVWRKYVTGQTRGDGNLHV